MTLHALCKSSIYALLFADHLQCSICLDIHTYRVFGTWPRWFFFFLVGILAKFFWEMQAVGLLILMLGIAGLSMGVLNLAIVIPQVWLPLHSFNVCQYLAPLN